MRQFLKRQVAASLVIGLLVIGGRIITALTDGTTTASDVGEENRGAFVIGVLLFLLSVLINAVYSLIWRRAGRRTS